MSFRLDVNMQSVERLSESFEANIAEIFSGRGICTDNFFVSFCKQAEAALALLLGDQPGAEGSSGGGTGSPTATGTATSATLSSEVYLNFLYSTLPRIIDVLLRRTTKRQHVPVVMGVLRSTVVLLTRRHVVEKDDMMYAKMMELRNHILCGSNTFRFVTLKELELTPAYNSYGLLGEHGKYESCIVNNSVLKFWPKDWQQYLGGQKGVGHFVSVFVDVCYIDSGSVRSAANDDDGVDVAVDEQWLWQDGQITAYNASSGLHTISTCKRPALGNAGTPSGDDEDLNFVKRVFDVNLSTTMHTWVDVIYREEVIATQKSQGSSDSFSPLSTHSKFLTYTTEDEGQFILIDHLISGKKYYAKIHSYDASTRTYNIVFDDKTSRELKFQDLEKDMNVTVIANIPEKVFSSTMNRSAGSSAKIIRAWYQSLSQGTDSKSPRNDSNELSNTVMAGLDNTSQQPQGAILPEANSGSGACYLKVELTELFYQEGGGTSIILSLSDESVEPPVLYVIILHLKLIYYLRNKLKQKVVEDLVLKLKDCITPCVSRYEEKHIKAITKQDLNVLIQGVKDIVFIVDPKNIAIRKEMELLNLSTALKLLKSHQLQKRYLGLSIIREQIEIVMPEILQRRYVLTKSGVGQGDQRPAQSPKHRPSALGVSLIEKFILDNDVYDAIFGESFHQDLALKSDFLLVFLALRGSLSEDHLKIIWLATCGGHEAIVRVLYLLILHIVPVLHPTLRMSLFDIVAATPQKFFTEQFLRLLKDFTLRSIQAFKNEKIELVESTDGEKESHVHKKLLLATSMEHLDGDVAGESVRGTKEPTEGGELKLKSRLLKKERRLWLGFAVLWRFVQDSSSTESSSSNSVGQAVTYVDEDIVDIAVQLLVELLQEDEFKDEREYVLLRCVRNIQLGCSVPTSMKIIRLGLALYPSPSSGWFSNVKSSVKSTVTVNAMIDKLNRQEYGNLLSTIFFEMDFYHDCFKKQYRNAGSNENAMNGIRVKIHGKRSKISHLNGLLERLHLLIYILAYSPNVALSTSHVTTLWKVYVEDATTNQIVDAFIAWIGKLLMKESKHFNDAFLGAIIQNSESAVPSPSKLQFLISCQGSDGSDCHDIEAMEEGRSRVNSAFAEGVLEALFETKIYPLAQLHADSQQFKLLLRPHMASFCMKLFLFVNHEVICTDTDGVEGWYLSSGRLKGLDLLWKLAISSTSTSIHEAASYLLVELHYRIGSKVKDLESIRGNFLKICFSEMSRAIQCLQTGEAQESIQAGLQESGIFDEKTLARRVARYVIMLSSFIKRFDTLSRPYSVIHVVNSRSGLLNSSSSGVDTFKSSTQFAVTMSETVGTMRDRIASHFNVSVEVVGLTRVSGVKYGRANTNGRISLLYCDNNECTFDPLEKDDLTLQSLKFKPMETFIVKRVENNGDKTISIPVEGQASGGNYLFGKYKKEDIFRIQDLDSNFMPPLNPFTWLGLQTLSSNMPVNISLINSTRVFTEPSPPVGPQDFDNNTESIDFFALPYSPLPCHDDMSFASEVVGNKSTAASSNVDDNNNIASILKQYLQKKPEHFSQLLQMLDGYFTLDIDEQCSTPEDTCNVSAVVWDVVQSLPCCSPLLSKVQKLVPLPTDSRGSFKQGGMGLSQASFFAEVFDLTSPYSMLYALQIVDAILSSTEGMLCMGRSQLEWGWKFIKLGGVEYFTGLLGTLMEKWCGNSDDKPHCPSSIGKGRADVEVLCLVMLFRLVHKFLLFDITYSKWQLDPIVKAGALYPGETMSSFVPPGLIVSYVNVSATFQKIMGSVFGIVSAYNALGDEYEVSQLSPLKELQLSTIESLIDHSIVLLFGLVKTVDNCVDVLYSFKPIQRFIRAITVRPVDSRLRQAGCRGLLQAATLVLVRAAIPHTGAAKLTKVRRTSRNSSLTLQPIKGLKRPSVTLDRNTRPVITPMSSLEDTSTDSFVSNRKSMTSDNGQHSQKRNSHRDSLDGGLQVVSESENQQRLGLFHAVFNLILQSVHPSFDVPDSDGANNVDTCLGPESYANGEEVYSLIAGMIALQGRPDILATAKLDFLSPPPRHSFAGSTLPGDDKSDANKVDMACRWVDDDKLSGLFFEKLITHHSQETFHSSDQDETLTGILRVLLVLVDKDPKQRKILGALRGQPYLLRQLAKLTATSQTVSEQFISDEAETVNLVEYLYSSCLFPKQTSNCGGKASVSPEGSVMCVSPVARRLAYALLLEVCGHDHINLTTLVDVMCSKESLSIQDTIAAGAGSDVLLAGVTEFLGPKLLGALSEKRYDCEKSPTKLVEQSIRSKLHWEYDPNVLVKNQNTYLGLVNQGCTCYMNAFLQQLFHVEAFTNSFLAIESHVDNLGDDVDDYDKDNALVLFELQIMFCYLKLSQKKYYDTISFAKVFKDYDLEPIRLGEQKDNNEFASMLFDKLESNEECKSLIKQTFGGELVWQVISTDEDCAYKSEREEPYFILTAEVEGKASLEDSLELYVTGEMLSGDNKIEVELEPDIPGGEVSKRKVDALRRCAIRTLPSVLLVHLKRFEFDVETMNRRKLNDLFTFPTELDMFPYTEEGLQQDEARKRSRTRDEDEGEDKGSNDNKVHTTENDGEENKPPGYYRYTLKGVVVHAGAIDSGHYYSFIRVRSRGSATTQGRSTTASDGEDNSWEWMEFNDTTVSPFSMDSIPSECFGGMAAGGVGTGEQRWKQHSAYMLIYERSDENEREKIRNKPVDELLQNREPKLPLNSDLFGRARTESASMDCLLDLSKESVKTQRQRGLPRASSTSMLEDISPSVLAAVNAENSSFQLDLMRFNIDYILFQWKLLQATVLTESLELISGTYMDNDSSDAVGVDNLARQVLVSRTMYLTLTFCFQVLYRARGQQCIPPFMEKLESLIKLDESGFCATGFLSELTRQISKADPVKVSDGVEIDSTSRRSVTSRGGRTKAYNPNHNSPELLEIESHIHPMLGIIFIDCPHTFTMDVFGRFLLSCIYNLRRNSHHEVYMIENAGVLLEQKVPGKSMSVELGLDEDDDNAANTDAIENEQDANLVNVEKFNSCVTRVVCKLLLLMESYQPGDVSHRRNFEVLTDTLKSFAMLGKEEEDVLLKLGAVYRVICSTVVLHPVHIRMPFRDCLRNAVDLACYLMKSALLPPTDSSTPLFSESNAMCFLTERDLQGFTSRMFLEVSLNISHPDGCHSISLYAANFVDALKNLCGQLPTNNVIKFFGFFLDKVFDNLAPTLPRTKLINDQIDLAFDVLSQLLIHLLESLVQLGKKGSTYFMANRDRTEFILDQTLAWIISQTTRICQRRSAADADFVDKVMKLVFRIGYQSELGFKSVMKMKDQWQNFPKVYCRALGSKPRPTPATSPRAQSSI